MMLTERVAGLDEFMMTVKTYLPGDSRILLKEEEEAGFSVEEGYSAIFLNLLYIDNNYRYQGYGDKALEMLCDFADRYRWVIRLNPSGDLGSDVGKLCRWYQKHGFGILFSNTAFTMQRFPYDMGLR